MNNARRKEIAAVRALIDQAFALVEEARLAVDDIRAEEQSYFDEMPDNFQQGDRGQRAEEVIAELESAHDALDEIDFESIFNSLKEAGQ